MSAKRMVELCSESEPVIRNKYFRKKEGKKFIEMIEICLIAVW